MAASSAGALKALIEGGGLGLSAYRDQAPANAAMPHVTILERIAFVPNLINARFESDGGAKIANETAQVSLWEHYRHPVTGALVESYTLSDALVRLLDGARLPVAPTHVWGVRFISSRRLPAEAQTNLIQTVFTLEVVRDI